MTTLIKQEIFKLSKKKSTWISSIILVAMQLGLAVWAKNKPDMFGDIGSMIQDGFLGLPLIFFFLVAACSSIITMEFQYNTIKEVLYRKYNRAQILVSKWITMFLYSIYWLVLTYAVTFVLKVIFFPKFDLGKQVAHDQTFMTMLSKYVSAEFLSYWLLLSLVLLMANLFKNSAIATTVGIVGYFVVSIVEGILIAVILLWEWVKWNPLTMLMYPQQIVDPGISHLTKLSLNQLFAGNVIYLIIFLILGYVAFARRNV